MEKLLRVLPKNYVYKIEKCTVLNELNFECQVRCCILNGEGFRSWLKNFESTTNTSWNLLLSKKNTCFAFSRNYVCQHSSHRKKKVHGKDKKCLASLSVRIKRITTSTCRTDPLLKLGFTCIIKINFQHSHKINVSEAWHWLPRSPETENKFLDLFNAGMSPSTAKSYNESLLLAESPQLLVNSRVNPPLNWIYYLYEKWRKKNSGVSNSDPDFDRIMLGKVSTYMKSDCLIQYEKEPLCFAIITPLMKRMIRTISTATLIFIDSTLLCDQEKNTITIVLVPSKAGSIPIGIGIHSGQSERNYTQLFSMLKEMWAAVSSFQIENFMTDDNAALKASLRIMFPTTRQLLYLSRVLQAFFLWLCNSGHYIKGNDKQEIMISFKKIAFSETLFEFNENKNKFFESEVNKNYPHLINYMHNYIKCKDEWCVFFRLNVKNNCHNTNNYSEATIRILKEVVLTRTKALNVVDSLDYVINTLENFLSKQVLDVVFNRKKRNHLIFKNYLDQGVKIVKDGIVEKEDKFYIVKSTSNDFFYHVDVSFCSCSEGIQGLFCKHQAAVHIKYGVMFPNAPILSEEERIIYYGIAVDAKEIPVNFLEPMVPTVTLKSNVENIGTSQEITQNENIEYEEVSSHSPLGTSSTDGELSKEEEVLQDVDVEMQIERKKVLDTFEYEMKRITSLVKENQDDGILQHLKNYTKKAADVKTIMDAYNFFPT